MDFGKALYAKKKKQAEAKKNQKGMKGKERKIVVDDSINEDKEKNAEINNAIVEFVKKLY